MTPDILVHGDITLLQPIDCSLIYQSVIFSKGTHFSFSTVVAQSTHASVMLIPSLGLSGHRLREYYCKVDIAHVRSIS